LVIGFKTIDLKSLNPNMLKIYELVLQLTSHKSVVYLICMLYKTLPSLLTCPLPFHDFSDSGEIALEKSERMVS
jgi:hypothetical protein